jgi:hypothetical protein
MPIIGKLVFTTAPPKPVVCNNLDDGMDPDECECCGNLARCIDDGNGNLCTVCRDNRVFARCVTQSQFSRPQPSKMNAGFLQRKTKRGR